jgi:hypothetical protein
MLAALAEAQRRGAMRIQVTLHRGVKVKIDYLAMGEVEKELEALGFRRDDKGRWEWVA